MASFASVTDGRAISSKYRAIRLKVALATTAEDIVESLLEKCHIDDIETVQPMPGRSNWIVVFTDENYVNTCLLGLTICGEKIQPTRVAKERYVFASVLYVPPDISNEEISLALAEFTEVKSIKYQYMADYPAIKTGKRLVTLKPRQDLPAYFDVNGVRATLLFRGRIACCPYCDGTDHLGRDCPNKRARKLCYECREYGHFRRDCPNKRPKVTEPAAPVEMDLASQEEEGQETASHTSSESRAETQNQSDTDHAEKDPEQPVNNPAAETESPNATPDIAFVSQNTPVLFSAPTPDSPLIASLPAGCFSDMVFDIPPSEKFTFTAPEPKEQRGARHRMLPVAPTGPGDKRKSKADSPRAGLRFPPKKADRNRDEKTLDTASKALDLG